MAEVEDKQELIDAAKKMPPLDRGFSLRPRNFEEAYRFANLMAESDLVPKDFQKKPANVLVAVQLGMELGVSPMQALQNICVINGRPAIWGDLLPAIVLNSGLLESITEEGDEREATCRVKRKGYAEITRTFSIEDAKRAGLAEKDLYRKYPKRMLQMRARAFAFRDMFSDVLKGIAVREDIEDIEITATHVEPLREPKAIGEAHDTNAQGTANAQHSDSTARQTAPEKKENGAKKNGGDDSADGTGISSNVANRTEQALMFIEQATDDEFAAAGKKWLQETIKGMSQAEQLEILKPYNARVHRDAGKTAEA